MWLLLKWQQPGLDLIRTDERNPLITTTFGVGELIKDALNHNVTKIILGIGGVQQMMVVVVC